MLRWFTPYAEYGKGDFHIMGHAILLAKTNHTIKNSKKVQDEMFEELYNDNRA